MPSARRHQVAFQFFERAALGFRHEQQHEQQRAGGEQGRTPGTCRAGPASTAPTGKMNVTLALTSEFQKPATEMAAARCSLGKISDSSTHITGPSEIANDATKPTMAISTSARCRSPG